MSKGKGKDKGKGKGAFSSTPSLPTTPFQSSSYLSHSPLHARSKPEHFTICPAAMFKSTDLTHYPVLLHAIKAFPEDTTAFAPCWELLGQGCLLVGLIWTHGSVGSHPQFTAPSLLMNWLGWWLTGPQGNWVGGSQVRSGSRLWNRSGEVSSCCWGLREEHPVQPLHLWEITRQPQSPR